VYKTVADANEHILVYTYQHGGISFQELDKRNLLTESHNDHPEFGSNETLQWEERWTSGEERRPVQSDFDPWASEEDMMRWKKEKEREKATRDRGEDIPKKYSSTWGLMPDGRLWVQFEEQGWCKFEVWDEKKLISSQPPARAPKQEF
jgi:hypothetical protein